MSDYYAEGWNDAKQAQFYGYRLPSGTMPNSKIRATYRAGWIAERASRKPPIETLPAYFMQIGARYYWIVSINYDGKPVYNCTNGEKPDNCAGYFNLGALMDIKGDSW